MSSFSQPIALTPSTAGFTSTFPHHERGSWRWRTRDLWLGVVDVYNNNTGLLLMMASQFCGTCMNATVKILNRLDPPIPTFEIILIRMSITYISCIIYMKHASIPYPLSGPPGVRHLLAIRGISGFFGIFGIYYSLIYLSLSDAIVITFLGPTTTAIAGYLILGEALSRREVIAGALSFLGVVLIARPAFLFGQSSDGTASEEGTPTQRLVAVAVALLGVLGGTGAFISIRAVGKRAHPLHSVSFFSIYSCLVSVIGMIVLRVPVVIPRSFAFVGLVFSIGFFGFFTQLFLTMSLQRETAGRASLGIYVQILFAVAAERWIFHTVPSALSIAGIIIIISCATFVAIAKSTKSENKQKSAVDVDLSNVHLERGSLEGSDAEREILVSGMKEEWEHDDRQDIEQGRHRLHSNP